MDEGIKRQILRHVSRALASGKEHSTTSLGDVTDRNVRRVIERTGIDIAGYERVIQSSDVRHVFRSHGDPATEAARGQIAVTKRDFLLIPSIVEHSHMLMAIGKGGRAETEAARICSVERRGRISLYGGIARGSDRRTESDAEASGVRVQPAASDVEPVARLPHSIRLSHDGELHELHSR